MSVEHTFQGRVINWMMETFSMEVCRDTTERNHRFLEESLELVQATGCTQAEAHMLVDYVFGRPVGEPEQEVGGVMVTLAALCSAADFSMAECGDREVARCWKNIEKIRAKQAGKPKHSPLPGPAPETVVRQDEAMPYIDVVFDGPPSHESGRFVEVENPAGQGINAGEWIDRGNGLWALRIGTGKPVPWPPRDSVKACEPRQSKIDPHCEGCGAPEVAGLTLHKPGCTAVSEDV